MRFCIKAIGIILLTSVTFHGICQNSGIQFSSDIGWDQVLQKAKLSRKFILVDCFATWCAPCREMDAHVYTEDSVGAFFNQKFISVRLQMDTSGKDNELAKARYTFAAAIAGRYKISAFPTFLFFSPEGVLVHRQEGYQSAADFVRLGKDALDPRTQYYSMVENFRKGKLESDKIPFLVGEAITLKDTAIARDAATSWIGSTLVNLPQDSLYQAKYIDFLYNCLATNIVRAGEKGFYLLYGHEAKVDSVMERQMYAEVIVDFSISKSEIFPRLWKNKVAISEKPDWEDIQRSVQRKYGAVYADRAVAFDKIRWYQSRRDYLPLAKSTVDLMAKYGAHLDDWDKNVHAWTVFQHDDDTADLNAAIAWMEPVLKSMGTSNGEVWDTYANLLYKKGDKINSLMCEKKAAQLSPSHEGIKENLGKMEQGTPTWPTN